MVQQCSGKHDGSQVTTFRVSNVEFFTDTDKFAQIVRVTSNRAEFREAGLCDERETGLRHGTHWGIFETNLRRPYSGSLLSFGSELTLNRK